MSSPCCDTSDQPQPTHVGTLTVALAGNPNSGKTTLFNALTGLRQKVANYPGVTVEKKTGRCKLPNGCWADVIDLPGTYSLISRSPDELVAMEVLRGLRKDTKAPDVVIVVVDASNLQRNLYLVSQLIELGRPLVVALNMMDIAQRRGIDVSPENLQNELGVPVIPVVGYKRKGVAELKAAVLTATVAHLPDFELPDAMRAELLAVGQELAVMDSAAVDEDTARRARAGASTLAQGELGKEHVRSPAFPLPHSHFSTSPRPRISPETIAPPSAANVSDDDIQPCPPRAWICQGDPSRRLDRYHAIAERLLIGDIAPDIRPVAEHEPVATLLSAATGRLQALGIDPMQADVEAHYRWIEQVAQRAGAPPGDSPVGPVKSSADAAPRRTLTQKIDAILIHKVWGLLIFAAIMGVLFVTLFWLAQPMMDAIQACIKYLGILATHKLPEGPVRSLLTDGIFNGVGVVVVFVPQIALLFLFLAILEDTGYLARAAFLMDRVLSKVGLHGKSFIPLLSSFACAIPGIMATRTIENRRERLATILVAPFMSCSARLPVYTLLIGAFFSAEAMHLQDSMVRIPYWSGSHFFTLHLAAQTKAIFLKSGITLGCYALGIVAAAFTAWIFKRTLSKGPATSFILELPSYKIPQVSQIARQVLINTRAFLTKAGTTIFCLSVILWAMAYYPQLPAAAEAGKKAQATADYQATAGADSTPADLEQSVNNSVRAAKSEYSVSGRLGHFMEPGLRPLGFDWKMGVGLVSAFAAREVFVSSMGIVYSVGKDDDDSKSLQMGFVSYVASNVGKDDDTTDLAGAMRKDVYASGKPVWTPLVAISLLIWFVLAMQCMSTFAIVRRETGGWSWPLFMIVYMNALAYVVCLLVFQVGSRLFA